MSDLELGFGLRFEDLYEIDGLKRIDGLFMDRLHRDAPDLHDSLLAARKASSGDNRGGLPRPEESHLLLSLAGHLEMFIAEMFGDVERIKDLTAAHLALEPVFVCQRNFVQRRAVHKVAPDFADTLDGDELAAELYPLIGGKWDQRAFADTVLGWLEDEEANAASLEIAQRYASWAATTPSGRERHAGDAVFRVVKHVYPTALVPHRINKHCGIDMIEGDPAHYHQRDGFDLTDHGTDQIGAMDNVHYCVLCHEREKDACSHGLKDRKTDELMTNPLGVTLAGCPLEERISEMHKAKMDGHSLSALAIVVVDNPMVAGTGHRICNDCMKSCIFQKQEPVHIPQVETRVLKDVLDLPWGFEIYGLLTRWNPLNFDRPLPKAPSGYKVLVVGLGPAGFTLSHHLLNEGHSVMAVDGLKIEPLPAELSGVDEAGAPVPFQPIRDWNALKESLDDRVMAGFGGVAEYGITVRWDKNFLKVLRLLLERRRAFAMYGGVRFGGTITPEQAFEMGFDHIALCAGAGAPTVLDIPNGLARGVRQASDFLMALQLTGAAKKSSIANLQIRLPVVVVGGGLTAIDTATEALVYYCRQVEKFLDRFEALAADGGEAAVRAAWTPEEAGVAEEFLTHGRAIRAERAAAGKEGRAPRFIELVNEWGGVTMAYRRRMIDAPSYTLNHEEVEKALEQGIRIAELLAPAAVEVDEFGAAKGLRLVRQQVSEEGKLSPTDEELTLPARTILVAAGTRPNTVLAQENPGVYAMKGKFYQALDEDGNPVDPGWLPKPDKVNVLMHKAEDGRAISFFGDLHPSYAGNVVKAMASAKQGYPVVGRVMARNAPTAVAAGDLRAALDSGLRVTVREVKRLTPTIVEVIFNAPFAAQAFEPGQFFRLQNYETHAPQTDGSLLSMEGIALTGAWVDKEKGLVSVIVLEMGGSSSLCAHLKPGEPVVLMGPTGAPTEAPGGETVLLAGGGLGNAVLFSIGKAMREAGSRVLYFAAYKNAIDRFHVENITAAADTVVWCSDTDPGIEPERPQDKAFVGNVVQAMVAYAEGKLGDISVPLSDVDRVIAIGSDRMMAAVAASRHKELREYLKTDHVAVGSINSPMQCMLKKVCAQCLQRQVDPKTGEETVVFTCFNQDQPLDHVDFDGLRQRLSQNGVQEKLTARWISRAVASLDA
ncbi:MAG: FAD-dependent oxidoreductase [Rhodospirillales bacterium]|nr:FAD-dependent oxidoreductase [Rhodospirillales bacterium]